MTFLLLLNQIPLIETSLIEPAGTELPWLGLH